MTWKDRKVTELKAGDVIQIRRDNARESVRSSYLVDTKMHEGKLNLFLNQPKTGNAFGEWITHQVQHDDGYIYFRLEETDD